MSNRTVRMLALAVGGAALLLATFIAGVRIGFYQWGLMDSSVEASLLTGELKALRAGSSEKLMGMKEVQLDAAVVRALQFQESGHPWLFWPTADYYEHERYLRAVAAYRKEHPSPAPRMEVGGAAEAKETMEQYRSEVTHRTAQLLDRYGK